MFFSKLKIITKNGDVKEFKFNEKTLIFSHENSVGKSTLLRILLYGLGYPIPSTKKMNFKQLTVEVTFTKCDKKYSTQRMDNYIQLMSDGNIIYSTLVSTSMNEWFALVWDIESPDVLSNLLGTFFLEQDKGWTLLN